MVKLKYSELSSFGFAQAMQKITTTPTHGQKASVLHKLGKSLGFARERISKEYQAQLVETYGKRDDLGKIIRPEGEPLGFEPIEGKEEEFAKAQEAFGDNMIELDVRPLTLEILSDMKISAQDLEALKGLYIGNTDETGPGVPGDNVTAIGGR